MDLASVDCICIDEAQYITNIGIILKHLIDMVRAGTYSFKIIVTGSGSLNVFKGMSDTLTGRKMIIPVYPLSFQEFL
jgi:predicted AAA+ superfamily ATPase